MSEANLTRLHDLLADRAAGELLSPAELRELDAFLEQHPDVDAESYEHAAAAIHLVLLRPFLKALPEKLRVALLRRLGTFVKHEPRRFITNPWLGWIAAAAAVLALTVSSLQSRRTPQPSLEQVASATDLMRLPWSATGDPGAVGTSGEVLWSAQLQAGYMRFDGLLPNDPLAGQYQLWIFDEQRSAEHPVDGGVFDAAPGSFTVPIDAKLAVSNPTLFAVTYEQPTGVVVSTRERLLLTAAPGA